MSRNDKRGWITSLKSNGNIFKHCFCVISSQTNKETRIAFFRREGDDEAFASSLIFGLLPEILGRTVVIRDLSHNPIISFECLCEDQAEEWVCFMLRCMKPSQDVSNSIPMLLHAKDDFIRDHPDSSLGLSSIINTPLHIKIESLQTLAAIPPCDRLSYVTHFDLSQTGIRSIFWKVYLGCISSNDTLSLWPSSLQHQRDSFELTRAKYMDVINQAQNVGQQEAIDARGSAAYQSLREAEIVIRKDCTRTFSHLLFFKSSSVQDLVVRLLLVFAADHPSIGYKQGMTDLLAIVLLCLFCERWRHEEVVTEGMNENTRSLLDSHLKYQRKRMIESDETAICQLSDDQNEVLMVLHMLTDEQYLEHDCYCMLESIMNEAVGCYVEQGEKGLMQRIEHVVSLVQQEDQDIIRHLDDMGIMPHTFLLRWIRLLLSREVKLESVFFLWDRLLLQPQPAFPLLDYLSAGMLLAQQEKVMACEGIQEALQQLQDGGQDVSVELVWEVCCQLWSKYEQVKYGGELSKKNEEMKKEPVKRLFEKFVTRVKAGGKRENRLFDRSASNKVSNEMKREVKSMWGSSGELSGNWRVGSEAIESSSITTESTESTTQPLPITSSSSTSTSTPSPLPLHKSSSPTIQSDVSNILSKYINYPVFNKHTK